MNSIVRPLFGGFLAVGMLGWGLAVEAAFTWNTTYLPGNKTYSATDGSTTVTTTVSGWADVPQGTTLDDVSSSIVSYGSYGLEIDPSGEYPPNDAVDADGPDEALGFTFSDKVALSSLTVGWAEEWQDLYPQGYSPYSNRTSSNTADLRVLAWVGSDAPPTTAQMERLTWADIEAETNLTDGAWKLVSTDTAREGVALNFNTDTNNTVTSSFWLIAAAPTVVTNTTCKKSSPSSWTVSCTVKDNDYFKLAALAGTYTPNTPPPPSPSVPAPVLLMGSGLPLLRLCRRRR
jgi:hypothetical protein